MYSDHEAESADTAAERKAWRVEQRRGSAVAVAFAVVILLAAFPPWRRYWEPVPGGGWEKYEVDVGDTVDGGDDPTEDVFRVTLGLATLGSSLAWLAAPPTRGRRRWAAFGVFAVAFWYTGANALAPSLGLGCGRAGIGRESPNPRLRVHEGGTDQGGGARVVGIFGRHRHLPLRLVASGPATRRERGYRPLLSGEPGSACGAGGPCRGVRAISRKRTCTHRSRAVPPLSSSARSWPAG